MLDYKFIELMFVKYSKHLQDVVASIETLVDNYDKQIIPLQKINDPSKYGGRIKELEAKKAEAFKKLSDVCPNIEKMRQQLSEIQEFISE